MKFYSYFLLGAVILNGKLLVLCNAEDFTGKLFERLGNGEAGNSTVRVENLEELASAILDGHYLSDAKSRCKEQDCSDQVITTPYTLPCVEIPADSHISLSYRVVVK